MTPILQLLTAWLYAAALVSILIGSFITACKSPRTSQRRGHDAREDRREGLGFRTIHNRGD